MSTAGIGAELQPLHKAMAAGRRVWATVLRGQAIKLVPGGEIKDGELLSWTYEGANRWTTVRHVVLRLVGSKDDD